MKVIYNIEGNLQSTLLTAVEIAAISGLEPECIVTDSVNVRYEKKDITKMIKGKISEKDYIRLHRIS